jgi:hypothetical protein
MFLDESNGIRSVGAFSHYCHFGFIRQHLSDSRARQQFIIDN